MSKIKTSISDAEFINKFEDHSLDPEYFSHEGHLRLAWLYLSQYDFELATVKISEGIQRYALKLGATDKFHATLTDAFIRIINSRMREDTSDGWQTFLGQNLDLVGNPGTLISAHYSKKLLASKASKETVAEPDIMAI